jgi:3-dehydroquinate dehydratase-2
MKKILVLHGPNLNLLGLREPEVYGRMTLAEIDQQLQLAGRELGLDVHAFQSNSEGTLIEALQLANQEDAGVILNPGGYTHTSVAIRDAIAAIEVPVIEVHLSNVYAREEFRHHSLVSAVCAGKISGFGWRSYWLALHALAKMLDSV